VFAFPADARDEHAASLAVAEAVQRFGRLDGLYHVAGGSGRSLGDGPLDQLPLNGWRETLDWNLTSLFLANRAAVQQFLKQGGGGAILNMSSVLAHHPASAFFATHAYAAAKAGVIGLTKAAAAYYAPQSIRINCVLPALVETPMSERATRNDQIVEFVARKQPLDGGRIGHPDDLDGAVVYLLSDEAKFVTGQVLCIDGGWSVSDAGATLAE
jgi:NAD(P)-dependent dehydrogenase (short-subunit alcohol dehydrogenase family)